MFSVLLTKEYSKALSILPQKGFFPDYVSLECVLARTQMTLRGGLMII